MKYIILTFTGIILFQYSFAQPVRLASEEYPEHRYYPLRGQVYTNTYIQIKGNPYLMDDWVTGDIHLSNNKTLPKVQFKFDTYAQVVIVYNDELKRLIVPEKNLVSAFSYIDGNNTRYFKRVNADFGIKRIHSDYFLEVLYEGEIAFYKLYLKSVLSLRIAEMPYIEEFTNESRYYIFLNDRYEITRLKKSQLKQQFPQYKKEISRYVRTNKLKLKREQDFAKVIAYLSQLESLVE